MVNVKGLFVKKIFSEKFYGLIDRMNYGLFVALCLLIMFGLIIAIVYLGGVLT